MGTRNTGTAGGILGILRDGRPRTKTELAVLTDQARSTVGQRLDALMAAGLVAETASPASTGGRPSAAYEFQGRSQTVLVAELGARHATFAVTNLLGEVLAEVTDDDLRIDSGPRAIMPRVVDRLEQLSASLGHPRVAGIGVGLPGPVEHASGRPKSPPIMPGWDGYDVVGTLRDRFGAPVLVDNDANLLALGEHTLAWPDVADLIYVKVATGVGAGILVSGELVRGAEGAAGDIGHVYTPLAQDRPCRCGNTGCLEALAGGLSIAQHLTELGFPADGAPDVAALARGGNLEAIRALRESGRAIGSVLATCIALLNPRVIVLGGELALVGEALLAGVRESVYRRTLPLASQHLRVVPAKSGRLGGALGAAQLVLDSLFDPEVFDESLAQVAAHE